MRAALAVAAAAALLAGGCGAELPDLFQVRRTGPGRPAVVLTVNDGGTATCNGGKAKVLTSSQLLAARQLARDLDKQAQLQISLPPAGNSLLRYVVRTQAGQVAFSDTSAGRPRVFDRVQAFTAVVARTVCR